MERPTLCREIFRERAKNHILTECRDIVWS